jgi:hypothetical protein
MMKAIFTKDTKVHQGHEGAQLIHVGYTTQTHEMASHTFVALVIFVTFVKRNHKNKA